MLPSINPLAAKPKDITFVQIQLELTIRLRDPRIFLYYLSRTPIVVFPRPRHPRHHFPHLLRSTGQTILLIALPVSLVLLALPLLLCLFVLQDRTILLMVSISFLPPTKTTVLVLHRKPFLLQKPTITGNHIPTPSSTTPATCLSYPTCISFDRMFRITSSVCE
jgi:hypothetical protein